MREPVTDVLIERAADSSGLVRMLSYSIGAHVAALLLIAFVPADWGRARSGDRLVMTISLGGAPGPVSGGMTPIGGRPVQQQAPPPARPQPVRPPAAAPPEMTMPGKTARPAPKPRDVPAKPAEPRGRTPTSGPEPQAGSAVAETGARGVGFGLTTGGGGGTGGYLDVANFCCPDYLGTMLQLIQRNWNSKQEVAGETIVKFTIQPDGRLTGIELERPSGYAALDLTAQRALMLTRQLPPLPADFQEDHLTVHLIFRYQR
jgi:TonB family protein